MVVFSRTAFFGVLCLSSAIVGSACTSSAPPADDDDNTPPVPCAANEHVTDRRCAPCAAGSTRAAGDDPTAGDTVCAPTLCLVNQRVSSHACVACTAGSTRSAGDDATAADTACAPTLCSLDHHVVSHACVPCAAGSTRAAGDNATGADTACDPAAACAANTRVSNHACVPCDPGTTNAAGDDPSGADTACDGAACAADRRVANHVCVACEPGSTNDAGDDTTGPDTTCDPVLCAADEHVAAHACAPCAAGTTRPAGDNATGPDTACVPIQCPADQHVVAHACVACPAGSTNAAGDAANGEDTVCDGMACPADHHVVSHACVPCEPGATRAAGDNAAGPDTACTATVCSSQQHVADHACVACAPGTTRAAGDSATGPDTSCQATLCGQDQRVVNHACVACAPGAQNAAGDDASLGDTTCDGTLCNANLHVVNHMCVPCEPGSTNAAGDEGTGPDTSCDVVLCGANERVLDHACVACAAGSTRAAGDAATGADTACTATLCAANERVSAHACVACVPGAINAADDDATGADTRCDEVFCPSNQRVADHACVACAPGTTNAPDDAATGADTTCDATLCGENQRVQDHACTACAPGSTAPAGADASSLDTECVATLCGADERVQDHACVACAVGSTRPAGDPATGANTTCAAILCPADTFVSNHRCVACPPGNTRAAGDNALGADTDCVGPTFTWTPHRASTLLRTDDLLRVTFAEPLSALGPRPLGGTLAAAAMGAWESATTYVLSPRTAWPLGQHTVSFSVQDAFGNVTEVVLSGTVTDTVYANTITGSDAQAGGADNPVRSVALALARARELGPLFPVHATLHGGASAADTDVSTADFEDVVLGCTNADGLGALRISATATPIRSTGSRETRVEGCDFTGAGPLDLTAGRALLRNTSAPAIRVSAGELTLESTATAPVTQAGASLEQRDTQNTGAHLTVAGGTATVRHVLLARLTQSGGTLNTLNTGTYGGAEVLGGAFTYRGGFIGQGTGNVFSAEAATGSPLALGVTFRGATAGFTHLLDDVEVLARQSVRILPDSGRLSVAIQDSGLTGFDATFSALTVEATDADVRLDRTLLNTRFGLAFLSTRSNLTVRDSRFLCATGNAITMLEDRGADIRGNVFLQCSEAIGAPMRAAPTAPLAVVGNTFVGGSIGILAGGNERIEHNVFHTPYAVAMLYTADGFGINHAQVRWNHVTGGDLYLDYGSNYIEPTGWVDNTVGSNAYLDSQARPTSASPCVLTRSAATAANMPLLAGTLDRVGTARTLPISKGAFEADGACACLTNERVQSGACVPCGSGATNAAGDNAAGPDTLCEGSLCGVNQRVLSHACVACAAGSTNAAGDNAEGADTTCDPTLCPANQRVQNHACVACAPGSTNAAGDNATGADTLCDATFCAVNQRVQNHACVACAPGLVSAGFHDASSYDTPCYTPSPETVNVVASGASAYWPLNEAAGPVAWDLIQPLPATGADVAFAQPGVSQTGVRFNGASSLDAPFDVGTNPAGSFSVEFWMEPSAFSTDFMSPLTSRSGPANGYAFYVTPSTSPTPNRLQFWLGNGSGWMTLDGPTLQLNTRYHVVGAYNATTTTMVLFVNGVAVASRGAAGFVPNTSRPLRMGAGATEDAPRFFFRGMLDEVVVYPRALFPADVTTRYAGTAAPLCAVNQRVEAHACVPCPAGHINAAGDDPNGVATSCDVWVCALNERVSANRCVACAAANANEPGDIATGPDTQCYASCPANQRVANGLCVPCGPGTTNAAGDLVTAVNTACDPTLCPANQFVSANVCVPCAPGSTNAAGDNASGADTVCDTTFCQVNQYVQNNTCLPCPPTERRPAGDPATGLNTLCNAAFCSADEHVVSNTCVACTGCTAAGGLLGGGNTTCEQAPGLPYEQLVRSDQPVLYVPFSESTGPVVDVVGQRQGVLGGTVALGGAGAASAQGAATFSGNGYVAFPPRLTAGGSNSIELWVAPAANGPRVGQILVDAMSAPDGYFRFGYRLVLSALGEIVFFTGLGLYGTSEAPALVTPPLEAGRWHHVVAVIEYVLVDYGYAIVRRLYVNGSLVRSANISHYMPHLNTDFPYVLVGGATQRLSGMLDLQDFHGKLDDFALYYRALSPADIWRHFVTGQRGTTYAAGQCGAPCAANEQVDSHLCLPCAPGSTNAAGDDPAGSDTFCDHTLCAANQRVQNHTCVACPLATVSAAGADAVGGDTTCEPVLCALDHRVQNHVCVPCGPGLRRPGGDEAAGPDTVCTAVSGAYGARVTGAGAVAYWPFNEPAGPVVDTVAGLTATEFGVVQFAQPGLVQPQTGLLFTGNAFLQVPYSAAHNPVGDFSVEFWMKRTSDSVQYQSPVTSRGAPANGYTFYVAPSTHSTPHQLQFWLGNGSTWTVLTGPPAQHGTRYHVVGTYSAAMNVMTLYLNGNAVSSTAVTAARNTTAPLRVAAGATEGDATFGFTGVVDEMAVYGNALSAAEVTYHYVLGGTQQ